MRYEPITPFTARVTLEDVEYRDVTFPKGTLLMADRAGQHPYTFGAGIHYCLGANLAKAEMVEGLNFLAQRTASRSTTRSTGSTGCSSCPCVTEVDRSAASALGHGRRPWRRGPAAGTGLERRRLGRAATRCYSRSSNG